MSLPGLHPVLRQSVFIAGTDTGIGKTWVATRLLAALAATGLRAAGMKPVAAGAEMTPHGWRNDDALDLAAAANVRLPYELVNPVCLPEATSPHLAAARAGVAIDLDKIRSAFESIRALSDVIVVEGAGGWLAPVGTPVAPGTPGPTMQDVALRLGLPVVLVVGLRLGCLSHALLTAGAIRASGLPLAGWIANPVDPAFHDGPACRDSLLERLPCPLLWSAPTGILPSQ
ncbi:MAG TPA: dethiobiotin synthase [Steroidobacteraceae bacterium]|nr:dethiobiotin synthase [Steroidobacteraceae bacterium]